MQSYPFCPDIWQMACILASKRRQPTSAVPNLNIASAPLADVLPHASAFQILVAPIAAQGIGLRLKRECPLTFHMSKPPHALCSAAGSTFHCGSWQL